MSSADQLSRATPYLQRFLTDEYVQEQIGEAITGLRRSSRRAKDRGATQALNDRRLRRQLSASATALLNAGRALRQPEPPKRHWVRRTVLLTAAGAAAVFAWQSTTNNHPD